MKATIEDYPGFHERMSRLREMEIGLDGAICTGDGEVRVHLPYMAACNQTLFNRITGLVKQGKSELNANKMSLKGIQRIVDYCYTGELEITEDNFEHIIDAALGLEFLNIVEQCVQFALTSNVNANIWCHFLRAAFKHPRSVQTNNFVPDLLLQNITKIPKGAIIKGLDAAYIREILEHGTFDDTNRSYAMNVFLEMVLADKADIKIYKQTLICMKDNIGPEDKFVVPPEVPHTTIMPLLELSLELEFTSLVDACVEPLATMPLAAKVTSQVLKWATQYQGSESEIHLNKICYHTYLTLPLDICEDDLCLLLSSNCLGKTREIDIYKTALKWIEHNKVSVDTKRRVVGFIRFGLMTKEEIDEVFKSHYVTGCEVELGLAMRYQLSLHDQPLAEGNINKMRLSKPEIYIMGGLDGAKNFNTKVFKSQVQRKHDTVSLSGFTEVCDTPFALYSSACAEVNEFLFVTGGDGALGTVNTMFRFDSRVNKWLKLNNMQHKREGHTLTAVGDTLVAVGGWDRKNVLDSVENYNITANTWTMVDPLPKGHHLHAASYVDGVLYITGGNHYKTLYIFSDNVWTEKSSMVQVRQGHAMTGVNGMLIVVGGGAYVKEEWKDVLSTEGYDVIQDQWTELTAPKGPCCFACSFRINNWYFVLGGHSFNEQIKLRRIQKYNIERNEWELCEIKLPNEMGLLVGECLSSD